MIVSRRKLFGFGAAFLAAPAIVRVASIMPVSVIERGPMTATELGRLQAAHWKRVERLINPPWFMTEAYQAALEHTLRCPWMVQEKA